MKDDSVICEREAYARFAQTSDAD